MKQAHDISIRSQIQELAKQHGVTGSKDRFSDLASTVTRLSGDVVALDTIERMLVSLKKQGILTKQQILQLEASYLREQSCSGSGRNLSA
ncbi:TPA: hypothetical protein U8203_005325 [Pseudomonas putida]|uniref:Uncharacterized protein n=1 Tax=Pseudomonas putida (strain W619) TaxID=390235 RepID=B1J9M4_PSEPW|nr:hypothetical protein [Pseudomonas putida]QQE81943.1 hypothetical protein JET17_14905 [Pseudomonas putida]HEN8710901.1 hypothetical protein [Pseudomonas putida]HEN8714718.1 hypothetical protein [Pseudomonas putida]HEN8715970.1 hypothetical protein [Pseudomonas putida]HEN8719919.1 hypothetical protein [Pseudomonas putida]